MSNAAASQAQQLSDSASLTRVLCGIGGDEADTEAVRQAALIAGPEGQLEIVCVSDPAGTGEQAQAEKALESAQAIATELGTPTTARVVHDDDPWKGLAGATADRDLLVLGDHPHSRAAGIAHRSTSTRALHDSAIPVLIARAGAADFPHRIMFATNGDESAVLATALTAGIARAHSSAVIMVTIDEVELRERKHALIEEAAELSRALGIDPEIVLRTGEPDEEIVAAARHSEASLLVLGSGGKHGIRALGSVSEKVAHTAPCSVLVARPAQR
jgi:nucleotide-binding universal stress UspA family protein